MDTHEQRLFRRLHALALRKLEATMTPEEHAELEALLLQDSRARRMYIRYLQDTACLRWLCVEELARADGSEAGREPGAGVHVESGSRATRSRRWLPISAAVLGALACSFLAAAWLDLAGGGASRTEIFAAGEAAATAEEPLLDHAPMADGERPRAVATVTALDAARWMQVPGGGGLLARCQVGQRWQLTQGRAELTFDSGVLVTVFAPADFDIVSSSSIRCRRGRVTALVDERGKGFTIETPRAKVVDLGTQFGLEISDDGETQVVVFQGSVDLNYDSAALPIDGGQTRRLEQGDAMLLKSTGELQRLMAVRRDRFLAPLGRSMDRPPVILDVRDNIRKHQKAKSYQIVHGGFGEDVLCFVDRDHQWNSIDKAGLPEFLLGADYIMPFNDDKFLRNLELEVSLARPATLYVFFDNNMEVPDWLLQDFSDTGYDIGLDGATTEWHPENSLGVGAGESVDFTFSVWRREIDRPGVVKLGGVKPPRNRPLGFNMYGIAAVTVE